MNKLIEKIIAQRTFYQSLMTAAFALKTVPKYFYLQSMLYLSLFNWFTLLILSPVYVIWKDQNNLPISIILELIQYLLAGILYTLVAIVLIFKKEEVISNYSCIQYDFILWSNKRRMNPNTVYETITQMINGFLLPVLVVTFFITFGPLLAAISDLGIVPLDDRSHFPLYLPKLFDLNNFGAYICMYFVQFVALTIFYISVGSYSLAFIVFLLEISNQFEMLLNGLKEAFSFRLDNEFKLHFIDCIHHHQLIIRFLEDFKSYFKWIILIEIIILQGIFATTLYNLIKGNVSIGHQIKIVGIVMFNLILFCFHCYTGEVIQSLHKRLAEQIYNMRWYDMPNKHKQLIIIMFLRTQRDLSISSAIFSNEIASRKLISRVMKQAYNVLNILLKT